MNKSVLYGTFFSFALVCGSALSMDIAPDPDTIPAARPDEICNNEVDMVMLQRILPDTAQMYEEMLCQKFRVSSLQEYQEIWERARVDGADTTDLEDCLLRVSNSLREMMMGEAYELLEGLHDDQVTNAFFAEVLRRLTALVDINAFIEEWDIVMGDIETAISDIEKGLYVEKDDSISKDDGDIQELSEDFADVCVGIEESLVCGKMKKMRKKSGLPMSKRKLARVILSLKPPHRKRK